MTEIYHRGSLWVDVSDASADNLVIQGTDFRGHPTGREYEYTITVEPDQYDKIRAGFGADASEHPAHVIAANGEKFVSFGEVSWLKAHGVEYDLRTWLS